ncbi:MAG TPA: aminotransferase class IV [Microbacterium sp.]|nr:aminotransferase class IV [Microbacterium sp.]
MELMDGLPADPAKMRALAFAGLAHFTTVLVEGGAVRGLDRHLSRLVADARTLFDSDLDTGLVRRRIREAIADEPEHVIVRITLFDPALTLERPGADAHPRILVSPRPAGSGSAGPLRVRSTVFGRQHPEIKHTGLFGSLYERRLAQRAGFDDAVFVDEHGAFSEGPTWNLGFVDEGGGLVWPDGDALDGVTRDLIASVVPGRATRVASLEGMVSAFATGSGAGIRPIGSIDEVSFDAAHPLLATIREAYAAIPAQEV